MKRNYPLLLLLLGSQLALTCLNAGVVTTSPEHEDRKIVVAKDESVTFTATPDSGDVTTTLTVDPSGPTISGSGSSQTATFAAGTEGHAYTCTLSVTHTDGDVTCTDGQEFTYTVYVPKLVGSVADAGEDIWYFEDGQGDSTYKINQTVSVAGIPTGKTMVWELKGQSDVVKFANNQETITGTDMNREIHTVGWSNTEDNLHLELSIDGNVVATTENDKFTARAPTKITSERQSPLDIHVPGYLPGYLQRYVVTIKDKFGNTMNSLPVSETFGSTSWPIDYSGCNWGSPSAADWTLDSSSQFVDSYGMAFATNASVPTTVQTLDPGAGTKVIHNQQSYKAGGARSAPNTATGFECYDGNAQLCRGKAYQY